MSIQSQRLNGLRRGVRELALADLRQADRALPRYYVARPGVPGAEYVVVDFARGYDVCTTSNRPLAERISRLLNVDDRAH